MFNVMVKLKIKDLGIWKQVFGSTSEFRKKGGIKEYEIYKTSEDPKELLAFYKWDSKERAQKFFRSPELKQSMEKAGVLGKPDIFYLDSIMHGAA